jgi:hypothetical protein
MKTLSLSTLTITVYLAIANILPASILPASSATPYHSPITAPVQPLVAKVGQSFIAANPIDSAVVGIPSVPISAAPAMTEAAASTPIYHSPQLDAFVANETNGQAGQVVGVFIPNEFSLPVVQQPDGQPNFVAVQDNEVTQFSAPEAYGVIGLLAHNFLSGRYFFHLKTNEDVIIIYGDGHRDSYIITDIRRYQALSPESPYSNFRDLDDPAQPVMTASQLFSRVYTQPNEVVLQTCIGANGDPSWGRLFITAEKVGG